MADDDTVVELQQNVLRRETRERRETRRETWGKSVTINIFKTNLKTTTAFCFQILTTQLLCYILGAWVE